MIQVLVAIGLFILPLQAGAIYPDTIVDAQDLSLETVPPPDLESIEIDRLFPIPPQLAKRVAFWRDVYAVYPPTTIIVHDTEYPEIVYGVFESDSDPEKGLSDRDWDEYRQIYAAITAALSRLQKWESSKNPDIALLTPEERRIHSLFSSVTGKRRFERAAWSGRIMARRGKRTKFANGLIRSGAFLPGVERTLEAGGAPRWLSALTFVESMCDPDAVSDLGATGIWQFIHSTALLEGLSMNDRVDERKDPYLSTVAVARQFSKIRAEIVDVAMQKDIFREDETLWPFIITSHNFGVGRVTDGIRRLKAIDIYRLLFEYKHPSKGFDVKNFYVQFLAALSILRDRDQYFPGLATDRDWAEYTTEQRLPVRVSFSALAEHLGVDPTHLESLNPALTNRVVQPSRKGGPLSIPKSTLIRFPIESAQEFASLQSYREPRFADWAGDLFEYVVAQGDTLSGIASEFGVKVDAIMSVNNLVDHLIRVGDRLQIPKI